MKDVLTTKAVWPDGENRDRERLRGWTPVVVFLVPAALVVAVLFLLVGYQGDIEQGAARLALLLPVGYAFAAGMVASVNPCGILMLSTYVLGQVRDEAAQPPAVNRALRAVLVAALVTLGFVAIFAVVGGVVSAGGQWLLLVFPYAGLAVGMAMIGLGAWLLASRRTLGITAGKRLSFSPQRSLGSAFLFGIVYAVASLSCTLPIFLVVVGGALAAEGVLASFAQFLAYALGMGAVILFVTLGAALFRRAMARWLRRLAPHVHRLSAMFLIGAGAYLLYYWLTRGVNGT